MMKLSEPCKKQLEDVGLILKELQGLCLVIKKIGLPGNSLPNYQAKPIAEFDEQMNLAANPLVTDCPVLGLFFHEDYITLSCWNWVPGPGPGDFEEDYSDESALVATILRYFFGVHPQFEARKAYELAKL